MNLPHAPVTRGDECFEGEMDCRSPGLLLGPSGLHQVPTVALFETCGVIEVQDKSIEQNNSIILPGDMVPTASGIRNPNDPHIAPMVEATDIPSPQPSGLSPLDYSVGGQSECHPCRWQGCQREFAKLKDLVNHISDTHTRTEPGTELYKCHWANCVRKGKGFNARYKILVHLRTHTKEKPHVCSHCEKTFATMENLKIHTRSHTGEKPYPCPYEGCGKFYANTSDRFKHVLTHRTERPYWCKAEGCGKRYTDPSSLRKHARNHSHGAKKDVCSASPPKVEDSISEVATSSPPVYLTDALQSDVALSVELSPESSSEDKNSVPGQDESAMPEDLRIRYVKAEEGGQELSSCLLGVQSVVPLDSTVFVTPVNTTQNYCLVLAKSTAESDDTIVS